MKIKLIVLLMAIFLLAIPAQANTITYSDLTALNNDDLSSRLFVYYSNGTLAGIATTNNTVTYNGTQDINIVLQPNSLTMFNNPTFLMSWVVSSGYGIVIIVVAAVAGFALIGAAFSFGTKSGKRAGGKKWRK